MAADGGSVLPSLIEFGPFELNTRLRCLRRNAEIVKLPTKPFDLLEFLVVNHDRVVSKEELLKKVWGEDRGLNVVEQTIRQVRTALKTDPADPPYIVTVTGSGYRFVAPLSFPLSEDAPPNHSPLNGVSDAGLQYATPLALADDVRIADAPESPTTTDHKGIKFGAARTRRFALIFATLGLLSVSVVGIFLYSTAPGEPAACEVSVNTLIVKDGQGRKVWQREFREHLDHLFYAEHPPLCQYVDLDHDGVLDVLFPLKPAKSGLESDALYGFITPSRLLRMWHAVPSSMLTFQPGAALVVGPNGDPKVNRQYDEYLPPYSIVSIFSKRVSNGDAKIIVSSGMGEAPDQIAVLDGSFNKLGEYWHSGELNYGQFAEYNGQDRIFLAGVNNGYRSATLVTFNPDNVDGTTDLSRDLPDQTPKFAILAVGNRRQLRKLGSGTETCRVLFERTCIAKAKPHREPYNRVADFRVTEDRVFVTVAEGEKEQSRIRVMYELDRHLNLVEAAPTTEFQQRHMELERAGLLDHTFSMEELKPLVHVLPGCEFVEKEK